MTWDKIDRCGVGVLSLPMSHPFTAACKRHDQRFLHGGTCEDMKRWNREFLTDMLTIVNFKELSDIYRVEAHALFTLCEVFGAMWLREENRLPMGNADTSEIVPDMFELINTGQPDTQTEPSDET